MHGSVAAEKHLGIIFSNHKTGIREFQIQILQFIWCIFFFISSVSHKLCIFKATILRLVDENRLIWIIGLMWTFKFGEKKKLNRLVVEMIKSNVAEKSHQTILILFIRVVYLFIYVIFIFSFVFLFKYKKTVSMNLDNWSNTVYSHFVPNNFFSRLMFHLHQRPHTIHWLIFGIVFLASFQMYQRISIE